MISIETASVAKLIFHNLNLENDKAMLSNTLFHFDDEQEETLKKIFLKPFVNNATTLEFNVGSNI